MDIMDCVDIKFNSEGTAILRGLVGLLLPSVPSSATAASANDSFKENTPPLRHFAGAVAIGDGSGVALALGVAGMSMNVFLTSMAKK